MRLTLVLLLAAVGAGCVGAPPQPCTTCGNKCVDTQSDPSNCGACSTACVGGHWSYAGCVNGYSDRDGILDSGCEMATASHPLNRGDCANVCRPTHVMPRPPPPLPDAGMPDAGVADAGTTDAGVPDAGP